MRYLPPPGTSVTVYGVLTNSSTTGNITTTYTLDGETSELPLPVPVSSRIAPMAPLFHADLKPGNHSLTLNLTEVASSDAYLGIDFIAFNSSVDSLAALGWQGVMGVQPSTSGAIEGDPVNIGAIVGGVVGGLAAIFLAICAFLLLRKRKRRASRQQQRHLPPIVLTRLHDDDAQSLDGEFFTCLRLISCVLTFLLALDFKPRIFDPEVPLPVLTKH
jgi:hypothetical protein